VSGGPLNAVMSGGTSDTDLGLLGGRQRPNLVGDPNTTGSDADRVASALHPDARFFSSAAFVNPGVGQYGNAPRTIDSARYQFRKNIDFVLSKEVPFAGSQAAEVRFEILNLTNTAKFGNLPTVNAVDLSSFGRVDVQAGFMRIWQLSFRYKF
jgi:trimeric autotransporter adhesin